LFSSRFHWDVPPNRLTNLLRAKRLAGEAILDLTESNPTRAGLVYPEDEIFQALRDPGALVYDPSPAGMLRARESVAGYYAMRGVRVDPEQILLTASTSEAYAYLFKLLTDPGDEVLAPRPSYPLFEFLAAMEGIRVVQYPLVYHGEWSIDFEALRTKVNERTRAVIVVNPNNPTGSYLKRDEVEELTRLAKERGLAILSDEVFADYHFGPDARRVSHLAGIEEAAVFAMSGLSKVAGLPQMKLGWIVTAGPLGARAAVRERLEWVADTYLSVSTLVQQAAGRLLEAGRVVRQQVTRRLHENRVFLERELGPGSPCSILALEGGWYATLQLPRIRREEEWVLELLRKDEVLAQPGFFYDFADEAFVVVSLLTETAVFQEGVRRILDRVRRDAR
jgi:aspartate/methionine/tyrosine aminotransferase